MMVNAFVVAVYRYFIMSLLVVYNNLSENNNQAAAVLRKSHLMTLIVNYNFLTSFTLPPSLVDHHLRAQSLLIPITQYQAIPRP